MTDGAHALIDHGESQRVTAAWPDFYFHPAYGHAVSACDNSEWRLYYHETGPIYWPVLLRPIDQRLTEGARWFDAVSPYGYSGPYAPGVVSEAAWLVARSRWRVLAREIGIVSEFHRLNPLLPEQASRAGDLHINVRSPTVLVELGDYDAYWRCAEGRLRTAVRKARRVGYTYQSERFDRYGASPETAFRRLYGETMERVGAAAYYHFPQSYYERMLAGLGGQIRIAEVCSPSGEVVASAMFLEWGDRLHYHLAGAERAAMRDGASAMLLDETIRQASAEGFKELHLGGGVSEGDALYRFKASFGGSRLSFATASAVLDEDRYRLLLRRRAQLDGVDVSELEGSVFFPPYARPLSSTA